MPWKKKKKNHSPVDSETVAFFPCSVRLGLREIVTAVECV